MGAIQSAAKGIDPIAWHPSVDPFGDDRAADRPFSVTARGLARLAVVAAEAGARAGDGDDAVRWMFERRPLFEGRSAFDACRDRGSFLTASLLHEMERGFAEGGRAGCAAARHRPSRGLPEGVPGAPARGRRRVPEASSPEVAA